MENEDYRDGSDFWTEDESDSESDSSSATFDSDSSIESVKNDDIAPAAAVEKKQCPQVKTKGEKSIEDLPLITELTISVLEDESEPIGKVHAIVDTLVVVRSFEGLEPIDLMSVLFLSHTKPLGHVDDVFGPVVQPFYCVRFNSGEDIKKKQIEIGMNVYYAPRNSTTTQYIFLEQLRGEKGSDASWAHNNEPPDECRDYSDDEQERNEKRKRQMKRRIHTNNADGCDAVPQKSLATTEPSPAPSYSQHIQSIVRSRSNGRIHANGTGVSEPQVRPANAAYSPYTPPPLRSPICRAMLPIRSQFTYHLQRPEYQFGQVSLPRPPSSPMQNINFQNFGQVCPNPALSPIQFIQTPPPVHPPLLTPHTENFSWPVLLNPQRPQFRQSGLLCIPPRHVNTNAPPPNVPLSVQVPSNFSNAPPHWTPPQSPFSSPPPTFGSPPPPYSTFEYPRRNF